jgi:hypothetical protein
MQEKRAGRRASERTNISERCEPTRVAMPKGESMIIDDIVSSIKVISK